MRTTHHSFYQSFISASAAMRMAGKLLATCAAVLAMQLTMVSAASAAAPKVMVVGDSISAGFLQPSYRKPLLQGLADAECSVDMVGDQELTSYSFNDPVTFPGQHFPDFSPANGDDTDHQAFGGIRADQLFNGATSGAGVVVEPIATYASNEQPDYVLLHAGTNDLGIAVDSIVDASEIPAWSTQTTNDMDNIIDAILDVVPSAKIIVGNFIPRKGESNAAKAALEAQMNVAYRDELTARISSRGDSRVLLADVATGFVSDTMTTDGVHPNAVGEQHIAGAFETVLFGAGLCQDSNPAVTSPTSGSVIEGDTATLNWTDNGASVNTWWVYAGPTQSGNDSEYFDSGRITDAGARSVELTGLPADGSPVYVGLWYKTGSSWNFTMVNYINNAPGDDGGDGGNGGGDSPAVTSPTNGSEISGDSFTLNWSANGTSVDQWWVFAGASAASQSDDYFNSGRITTGSTTSAVVSGMPQDGSTVHVSLWYKSANTWNSENYTYTSTDSDDGGDGGDGGGDTPAVTSPSAGSVINGSSFTLNWNANGTSVSQWWVFAGASAASQSDDYFNSGRITTGSTTSAVVSGMPQDGSTVHVSLWYKSGNAWNSEAYTYTSADSGDDGGDGGDGGDDGGGDGGGGDTPAVTSPSPGSSISGSSFTLNWDDNGTSVSQWWVFAGASSASQSDDYFNSGRINSGSTSSAVVTGMPQDGSTVHVSLWYKSANVWNSETYTYTSTDSGANGGGGDGGNDGGDGGDDGGDGGNDGGSGGSIPAISSPVDGATINGSSYTLKWNRNGANVTEYFIFMGTNPTSRWPNEYFESGRICVLNSSGNPSSGSNDCDHEIAKSSTNSFRVSGMPQDGSEVIVALWFKIDGKWLVKPRLQLDRYTSARSGGSTTTIGPPPPPN